MSRNNPHPRPDGYDQAQQEKLREAEAADRIRLADGSLSAPPEDVSSGRPEPLELNMTDLEAELDSEPAGRVVGPDRVPGYDPDADGGLAIFEAAAGEVPAIEPTRDEERPLPATTDLQRLGMAEDEALRLNETERVDQSR